MLLATTVAWRWPWVGTGLFIGWAVSYLAVAFGSFPPSVCLFVAGLPTLLDVLFPLNWLRRDQLRAEATHPPTAGSPALLDVLESCRTR
jgi:hypothetical protein